MILAILDAFRVYNRNRSVHNSIDERYSIAWHADGSASKPDISLYLLLFHSSDDYLCSVSLNCGRRSFYVSNQINDAITTLDQLTDAQQIGCIACFDS